MGKEYPSWKQAVFVSKCTFTIKTTTNGRTTVSGPERALKERLFTSSLYEFRPAPFLIVVIFQFKNATISSMSEMSPGLLTSSKLGSEVCITESRETTWRRPLILQPCGRYHSFTNQLRYTNTKLSATIPFRRVTFI